VISVSRFVVSVHRACNGVRVTILLDAARTTDETSVDELALPVLHVRSADRLVELLRSEIAVVEFDEFTLPVDGEKKLGHFGE